MYNEKRSMLNNKDFINILREKNYEFVLHEHKPVFTVNQAFELKNKIKGHHTKNLFLKNKKNLFFLFSCKDDDSIDLKKMSKILNLGSLSFAKEEYLDQHLKIKPGSVSPFALLNDAGGEVDFYLEQALYESKFVNFHPLINTFTITIETNNFIEFMIENDKKIHIFSSMQGKILNTYG